jgi:hypothetical protein
MVKKLQFNKKKKKGLSTIVVTLLLIALSLVAVGILWTFVNNLIKKQINSNEACYGNFNKVEINDKYTCYEVVLGANPAYNLIFSLSIKDVNVDKVIVSVSSANSVKGYEITNFSQTIPGLKPVPSGTQVKLPDKNAGLTYNATGFASIIESMQITPVIGGAQCEVSDTLSQIENCALLA